MRLLFDNAQFRYDPYPIGIAKPILDEASYAALVESFPPAELLPHWGGEGYHKFALNERMAGFHEYLAEHPVWWAFHNSIKQQKFIEFILSMLQSHKILVAPSPKWTSRFEFAMMPANGGKIAPHTDISSKAVTLIFSMMTPGERETWDPLWGGGTDVLKPRDPTVPLQSYKAPLEVFEKVATFDYTPNQCVIFIKNDVSWHSVGPMVGPAGPMRRTITLNIERGQ